jgi:hypothetical protein
MKKLLFFVLLLISTNTYSQENYFGKTINEIYSSVSHTSYTSVINNRKVLYEMIDTNITAVYYFNSSDICYEYVLLYQNTMFSTIERYLSSYYKQSDEIWVDHSSGLTAMVNQLSNNLYKISIRKFGYYNK